METALKRIIIPALITSLLWSFFLGVSPILKIFFRNTHKFECIEVLSFGKIDTTTMNHILRISLMKLIDKKVSIPKQKQVIVLCENRKTYLFFALNAYKTFAINKNLTSTIFISAYNLKDDKCFSGAEEYNERKLSGVITHEIGHSILEDKLGFFRYSNLPKWKNEGFCDYLAEESSYDYKIGIRKFIRNEKEDSMSYQYFKFRVYAEHLLKTKKETLNVFLMKEYNLDLLKQEIIKYYSPRWSRYGT